MMHIRVTGKQIEIGKALSQQFRGKLSAAAGKRIKNHHRDRGGQSPSAPA
jgi:ribosome-associated translation inhibitor RaiA